MKRTVLFIVLFIAICGTCGVVLAQNKNIVDKQDKTEPSTQLEKFLSKKGHLYIKTFYEAGTVSGLYGQRVEVKALIINKPGKNTENIKGLKIEVHEGGRLEKEHSSFLDIDEVESLSQALGYMINLMDTYEKENFPDYREVVFGSRGDFNVGFYQKQKDLHAFASSGYIGKSTCFLSKNSLVDLKNAIDKGLSLAKTKRCIYMVKRRGSLTSI